MNTQRFSDLIKENSGMDGRGHAVVIGGSLAGLLAARVLADHFDRVTVIERDQLPLEPASRKGVPQARHLHVLLARGRLILEEMFPGIMQELAEASAPMADMAADVKWLTPAGWGVRFKSNIGILPTSRDLLEFRVRRRVSAIPGIYFIDECDVTGLTSNAARDRITGLRLNLRTRPHWDTERFNNLQADLVVDAGGRGSKTPKWLEELGYAPPEETVINAFLGYASRIYRQPESRRDWQGLYVQAAPPAHTRGGVLFPIEGNRWLLTIVGLGRDYPPTDEAGFLEFARSMRTPIIYDAIKDAEPLSDIYTYRATENRVRHYEHLTRRPEGLIVMGDAACAFNPVYGQGMTTAALGAETLRECIEHQRARHAGDLTGIEARFQKRLAKANSAAWMLATGEDLRVPQVV
ncbi:MAG TPA: 2-polyprenyl-6-methoxyphenol hydroxylase-like oxidoreductase, partial [Blastocatellia bacterium]|nr:2-polyprenyl-6-methoxyphenol hydroxylase-like oxidoreductase [Blastocatellia bacterium]